MAAQDFMPLEGWDHVELWVGNAKQAAYFYEQALGFTRVAYGGPETGMRDRASYVLEQGEIRLVLTSGLRSDSEIVRTAIRCQATAASAAFTWSPAETAASRVTGRAAGAAGCAAGPAERSGASRRLAPSAGRLRRMGVMGRPFDTEMVTRVLAAVVLRTIRFQA